MATSLTSAAPPTLPAERFYRFCILAMIFTSALTLSSTGKLDFLATFAPPLLVLWKGYRVWQGRPAELQAGTATRLVVLYILLFPLDALFISRSLAAGTSNPGLYAALLAAVHFLLFVTLVRLFSATTDRDGLFLAMLSFAAMLAAAVLTIDTQFFVFFFLFLLFTVGGLLSLEIRRGAEGAVYPPLDAQPVRKRRFLRALALATVGAAVGGVLAGSALFFFFPRFSAGYLARAGIQSSLMSGFSDSVELGQIGEIKKNSEVVMRVQTGSEIGYPLLRWRGIALSHFDGKRWNTSETMREALAASPDGWISVQPRIEKSIRPGKDMHFTVLLQPLATDSLFAPIATLRMRGNFSGDAGSYSATRRVYLFVDHTSSIFNPYHNFAQIRYEGDAILPEINAAELRSAGTEYPEEVVTRYLQLPSLDPRIAELAKRVTATATNNYDRAVTLQDFLRRNYSYTLNLTGKPGDDPLPHFLFETHAGHCEYFASSLAVMLRTLGIPSREVNGFLPGEFNDIAGDYIVRASDAHSWVEAYFPGVGWMTFDPTPPSLDASGAGLFSRLNHYVDWMQLTWNEWVINYDFSHQVVLAQNMQQGSRNWSELIRNWVQRKRDHLMDSLVHWQSGNPLGSLLLPLIIVLLIVVLRFDWIRRFFLWLLLSMQLRGAAAGKSNPQLASRLYMEMLHLLRKRGLSRLESQTPMEFAVAPGLQPELAPAVREFTVLYTQARFGNAACDAQRLRSLLDQIRSTPRPR